MIHLQSLGGLRLKNATGKELLGRRRTDLAALVVLADRGPTAVRREELQALFWGERTEEKARHSLRQVISRLRETCGDAIEVDLTSVRVREGAIDLDATAFAGAASGQRWREAVTLWHGDFLPGCEDIGTEEFRVWLEVERERLRRLLARCYDQLLRELASAGQWEDAARFAAAWGDRFPLDEATQLRRIEVLCQAGRPADAAAARDLFLRRLKTELEVAPSDKWTDAVDRALREAREAPLPVSVDLRTGEAEDRPSRGGNRRMFQVGVAAAAFLAIAILGVQRATARPDRPPLAVGEFTSALPQDSVRGFATLLTIDLARIAELDVVSDRRLSEILARSRSTQIAAAAQLAGARELLDGVLARGANHALRADLRRTDLATGKILWAFSVEASDFTQLADQITDAVARNLGLKAPASRREGTTESIIAYRLYEQGVRAYYESDNRAARRLLTAALAEDSTFAMAAFYRGRAEEIEDSARAYLDQAVRHSTRATDRERLLINAWYGRRMRDPRALAWAETLVTRYPSEPDAHIMYAGEMSSRRNLPAALAHLRRVVEMDSATGRTAANCRACEALSGMIDIYLETDSFAVAERHARTLLRWQPKAPSAWMMWSRVLGESGRFAEAHAAVDTTAQVSGEAASGLRHVVWWLHTNDFAAIDRAADEAERSSSGDLHLEGLWTQVISFGTQGRIQDALRAARSYRQYRDQHEKAHIGNALLEAVALLEAGQAREAATLFDSMALANRFPRPGAASAWHWTHAAAAYAASGDTMALAWLEDSVRAAGMRTTERYQRLHHYVHGLRLAARKRPLEAANSFRQAVWGPQDTHVRIYLELGRSLLAAGRPGEAISPLVAALDGPPSAAGLYATRSELQAVLGEAYERSNQPDSALVQYRAAVNAWRNADPQFADRRSQLQSRITALSRLQRVVR